MPATTDLDELSESASTPAIPPENVDDTLSDSVSGLSEISSLQDAGAEDDPEKEMDAGFEVGFAEDKNKKYRRTMEVPYLFARAQRCHLPAVHSYCCSGWFAIFDGHAGKAAADWCGENLHQTFANLIQENPHTPVPELMNQAFHITDSQLGDRKGYSGCTAVVAFIRTEERPHDEEKKGRVLYTANVGDARAVLCRDGQAVRLSYDHKGSDPAEAKRVIDTGGFMMNNRVNGVLAVTRSLGDVSMKEWIIGSPYTTETVLTERDSFLILACDGLWDVCTDQTASDLIRDVEDPQKAAEMLLEHALENFSTDNLSVLTVRLDQKYLVS
ncbi:phosphatase 2C-like domain-containing protein [Gaertneriomyces semiglobifer]|nr:phosphatase 2C-like domain-containing protein [Gaertneriomyces semiglobifer]